MQVVSTELELRECLSSRRQAPIALVPTMGALHEGHLALIAKGRETAGEQGTLVVSIFVNPLQFDRKNDLEHYPRPLEQDLKNCEQAGVDVVFCPSSDNFYQPNHSVYVSENQLTKTLCGASRPGHFDGVCTVVLKLFNQVGCDYAIFGKKDYQQLKVIERMVRDLSHPVQLIPLDTIREDDGLALSSRNRRLSAEQRADAPRLYRALLAASHLATTGEQSVENYLNTARSFLEKAPLPEFKIDYLELLTATDLTAPSLVNQKVVLAVAAFYGEVRLIDNLEFDPTRAI